jgi:hypothetical protein
MPLVLVLFVTSLSISLVWSHNYCPVTSRYDPAENGYLPFPSLYWPDQQSPEQNEVFYNCSVRPKYARGDWSMYATEAMSNLC